MKRGALLILLILMLLGDGCRRGGPHAADGSLAGNAAPGGKLCRREYLH